MTCSVWGCAYYAGTQHLSLQHVLAKHLASHIADGLRECEQRVTSSFHHSIMTPPFTYTPLPNDSIRLLTVAVQSEHSGTLTCTINTFSLDDPLRFYALSYTWGAPSKTETILCNGHEMKIAASLTVAVTGVQMA